MAAKLTEHTVKVNGGETTMLLDSDDVERYRKAKLLAEERKVANKQAGADNKSGDGVQTSPNTKK